MPTNNGVAIVPGSFNVAPTKITTGPGSETLEWDLSLPSALPTTQTITWQSTVTGLQAGQTLAVTQGATVAFVARTCGTLSLPGTSVTGRQVVVLTPTAKTVAVGTPAAYTVTLFNPTSTAVTYNLAVQGVPLAWVSLASSVKVGPQGSATVPLTLTLQRRRDAGDL